jgi:two-component system chemotaxis response regulator CheY
MIVDDSKTMLMAMAAMLTKFGFQVDTAGDGVEALLVAAKTKPALVITDLHMPRMDGMTFIREARKTPHLRFVPILMLTTESQEATRLEAKTAGATGWLVKPVKPADLQDVIKRLLPGS